ncbi:MAG: BON domain-containing protein [Steroidobacteraceae bacterium]
MGATSLSPFKCRAAGQKRSPTSSSLLAHGLKVRVRDGAAYISALTFDPSVRDEAMEIARKVPGVAKVVNEIDVSAGSGY